MLDFISSLPSNDKIDEYREEELNLQLLVLDWLWETSIDNRLAQLGESNEIVVETTKKSVINGKRIDVPHYETITARGISSQWSIKPSEKEEGTEKPKKKTEIGFLQSSSSVLERLNAYRFYPYTEQLASEFSAMLRTKKDSKEKLTKYALVSGDNLRWFNLVCKLRTMEGQTKHFFGNARRAFLRETRGTFMDLRAYWETPREEARVTNRAHNNLGIGAEARAKAIADLGIDTTSLRAQIDREQDPGRKLELMERLLRYEQGKADLASKYAAIAKENTEIIKDLRAPATETFRESMLEGREFTKENIIRDITVQRKLKEASNE